MDYNTNNPDEIGIEYLDNFYEQCFSHYFSDSQKKNRRNRLISKILRLLSIYTILILLFIFYILVLIAVMVLGLAIPFNIYGVPKKNLWVYIFVLFMAASGFTGILLPNIIELCVASIKYREKVYAVCIENSRPNYSSILKPVFYAKCKNGHKYMLFNDKAAPKNTDTDVGDIIKLSVDSNNPFNYTRKSYLYELIFCGIIYTAVTMGLYILFNIYKF